jgi:hypothetical protein
MKKSTKASAVMKLLKKGYTSRDIKDRMAVSESYIYAMKKKLAEETTPTIDDDLSFTIPEPEADTNVDAILNTRASNYGSFLGLAQVTQRLKAVAHQFAGQNNKTFDADQAEALDLIFTKIGRILNGDPNYVDSWTDIAGYATLVADRLEGKIR